MLYMADRLNTLFYDAENFKNREFPINPFAGFLGDVISIGITNAFKCFTVAKQTNPDCNMTELIKKERFSLLTKRLMARVCTSSHPCNP